jgi:hypothetical protein
MMYISFLIKSANMLRVIKLIALVPSLKENNSTWMCHWCHIKNYMGKRQNVIPFPGRVLSLHHHNWGGQLVWCNTQFHKVWIT